MAVNAAHLLDAVLQVPGSQELTLLEVHGLAGFRRSHKEIRLTAEKGGDLQYIHSLGGDGALVAFVHIREHGHAKLATHLCEDVQSHLHARTTLAVHARAIGLVEAGLIDERNSAALGDVLQLRGHEVGVLTTLDDAGPRDEEETLFGVGTCEIHGQPRSSV